MKGQYRYIMATEIYNKLTEDKVIEEARSAPLLVRWTWCLPLHLKCVNCGYPMPEMPIRCPILPHISWNFLFGYLAITLVNRSQEEGFAIEWTLFSSLLRPLRGDFDVFCYPLRTWRCRTGFVRRIVTHCLLVDYVAVPLTIFLAITE